MSQRLTTSTALLGLLWACSASTPPESVVVRQQTHMTTYVTISVAAAETPQVLAAIDAGFAEVARLESELSEWQPGSQVAEVVRQAGVRPVRVSEPALSIFTRAVATSRASGGAFDITVGSLWGLWDFKWQDPRIPSDAELAAKLPLVDWRKIAVDEAASTLYLSQPGMKVALGGIAKGYIMDRVSDVLRARGFPDHLVIGGGDGFASGRKYGKRWRVGIRHPEGGVYGTIDVSNEGFATSGNYERYFIQDGVRYHHIIDPHTGKPARGVAASTVIAPDAFTADANGKAVFVLGPVAGLEHARKTRLEALVFSEDTFEVSSTPGMRDRVTIERREEPGE